MKSIKRWAIELMLLMMYFFILVFAFLPSYLAIYSSMLDISYRLSYEKLILGIAILVLSNYLLLGRGKLNTVYGLTLRLFYLLSFIPMIALYCCGSKLHVDMIIEPALFGIILMFCLRYYAMHDSTRGQISLGIRPVVDADIYVLFFCGVIAVVTWSMAGFPIVASFSDGYEQRMALRGNGLPTIINYLYVMTGGTLLPFLFAKNIIYKKRLRTILSLSFGLLMYFVNGMKTWLFLYIFAIAIIVVCKKTKTEFHVFLCVEMGVMILALGSIMVFSRLGVVNAIGLVGRVIIIPNNIGFKIVEFFRRNELLYLRESLLRLYFDTPYEGGSDFYIIYGNNATLTSSRANNGLYGDAFKNFGMLGIIIYPILTVKVMNIIERNCRYERNALRYYIMFILLWGAINTSFFTWLLTGGVILLFFLLKISKPKYTIVDLIRKV